MVVRDQTEMFLNLNHHPVCALRSFAMSSYWRCHPSCQERRGLNPSPSWLGEFAIQCVPDPEFYGDTTSIT